MEVRSAFSRLNRRSHPSSSFQNGGPSVPKAKHSGKNDFRYLHVGYKASLVVRKMIKRRVLPPGVFLYSPCFVNISFDYHGLSRSVWLEAKVLNDS